MQQSNGWTLANTTNKHGCKHICWSLTHFVRDIKLFSYKILKSEMAAELSNILTEGIITVTLVFFWHRISQIRYFGFISMSNAFIRPSPGKVCDMIPSTDWLCHLKWAFLLVFNLFIFKLCWGKVELIYEVVISFITWF